MPDCSANPANDSGIFCVLCKKQRKMAANNEQTEDK
jgi:hypothetical protein